MIYVHIYIQKYVVSASHVSFFLFIHICIYIHMIYVHIYIQKYVYRYLHLMVRTLEDAGASFLKLGQSLSLSLSLCMFICIYIYTYIYTYMYTYIGICISWCGRSRTLAQVFRSSGSGYRCAPICLISLSFRHSGVYIYIFLFLHEQV